MGLILLGILLTSLSIFSMWGGTPVPLGVVVAVAGLAMVGWGFIRLMRKSPRSRRPRAMHSSPGLG